MSRNRSEPWIECDRSAIGQSVRLSLIVPDAWIIRRRRPRFGLALSFLPWLVRAAWHIVLGQPVGR